MGLTAPVVDGKIQDASASANSLSSSKVSENNNSSLDKDAFLQLLVAQMKYQDPLEPTSNTEYISQFATFSELEEMQNMRASMDIQRASSLVGKEVIINTTNSKTGATQMVQGKVDYVVTENGKAYLSIDEGLYSIDDLYMTVDGEYQKAYDKATELLAKINKLPSLKALTVSEYETVKEIKKLFDSMSDYEKSFVAKEKQTSLEEYVTKMKELLTLAGKEWKDDVEVTEKDMMQDLLDKLDKILGEIGNISSSGGSGGTTGGTGGTEESGGTTDETGGSSGETEGSGQQGGE